MSHGGPKLVVGRNCVRGVVPNKVRLVPFCEGDAVFGSVKTGVGSSTGVSQVVRSCLRPGEAGLASGIAGKEEAMGVRRFSKREHP
jgi:hypothetical protein